MVANKAIRDAQFKKPRERVIKIDPRIFISGPFIECTKCGKKEFGVLSISDQHFVRRCRACWHDESFDLPSLNKKVLYVDQFAISEMMKVLNPEWPKRKHTKIDSYWLKMFRKLDRLAKLHLIVCPDSITHEQESMTGGRSLYDAAKRMYEHLSGGLTFQPSYYVEIAQLREHIKNWIAGRASDVIPLNVDDVLVGKRNAWWDRMRPSVTFEIPDSRFEELKRLNPQVENGLKVVQERWRKERKILDEWFFEEVRGQGRGNIKEFKNYKDRLLSADLTVNDIINQPIMIMKIKALTKPLEEAGVERDEIAGKVLEYLTSDDLQYVPYIRISAYIFAAAANKVGAGQKSKLTNSILSDATIVGSYLPYCDAMFLDRAMVGYVSELQKSNRLPYSTRVFSRADPDQFLGYLDTIEKQATSEHLAKVKEVYGKSWTEPYETMYRNRI